MDTKKEKILLAAILAAVSKIEAHLQGAKCGKCGKCGHQARTETEDYGVVRSGTENAGTNGKGRDPQGAKPERLPDVPDWRDTEAAKQRDGAAQFDEDDKLTQIRLIVSSMQGESLSDIIKAILADGTDPKALAAILGVNQARISEALHGKARPKFKEIFTEVLGCDGGASVKSVKSKKSKKRGAK